MNDVTTSFWEATYKQNIAKMVGVCYRYTADRQTAEDLAHDAFLIAIDKSSSFENKGPFEAWLRRIVVNVSLQYLREQKKQQHHANSSAHPVPSSEPLESEQSDEEHSFSEAELLDAIAQLPEHHKLVFNLYVFDRFTHAQIRDALGISEGTSKSHLARARKKLKEILTQKAKDDKKRRRLVVLFLLPDKLWPIDRLFFRQLNQLEIQPQQAAPNNAIDFSKISTPKPKSVSTFFDAYTRIDMAAVAIVVNMAALLFVHFNSYKELKAPMESAMIPSGDFSNSESKKNTDKNSPSTDITTATFSKNDIISHERIKTIEDMKKLNTLGALLLTSSALAVDSSKLLTDYPPKFPVSKQEFIEKTEPQLEPTKPTFKSDSAKVFGTFYAAELFWSAESNELYFRGNDVKIALNTQKFTGSGEFSFLNKVSYLVINGTPMKANEKIRLSNKKYSLVKLTEEQAIKKYGDKGRIGTVEITLAE